MPSAGTAAQPHCGAPGALKCLGILANGAGSRSAAKVGWVSVDCNLADNFNNVLGLFADPADNIVKRVQDGPYSFLRRLDGGQRSTLARTADMMSEISSWHPMKSSRRTLSSVFPR